MTAVRPEAKPAHYEVTVKLVVYEAGSPMARRFVDRLAGMIRRVEDWEIVDVRKTTLAEWDERHADKEEEAVAI
jgi:hypothetical protein